MVVVLSRFRIANGMTEAVHEAFRRRPHRVDSAPGFVRLEVLSPRDRREEVWLVTYWSDEESFRRWYRSHQYREAHEGMPPGLELVPGSVRVEVFDHVAS